MTCFCLLPRFDGVEYIPVLLFGDVGLHVAAPGVLVPDGGGRMVGVGHHPAGYLGQSPNASGRARARVHFAERSGDLLRPPPSRHSLFPTKLLLFSPPTVRGGEVAAARRFIMRINVYACGPRTAPECGDGRPSRKVDGASGSPDIDRLALSLDEVTNC